MTPPVSHPIKRSSVVNAGPQIATAIGTSGTFVSGLMSAPNVEEKIKSPIARKVFLSTKMVKNSTMRQNSFCSSEEDQNNNATTDARMTPMITRLFISISIPDMTLGSSSDPIIDSTLIRTVLCVQYRSSFSLSWDRIGPQRNAGGSNPPFTRPDTRIVRRIGGRLRSADSDWHGAAM